MTLLDKIKSRGYWKVTVRPIRFVEKRIPEIRSLYPIIEKTAVHLRGWDFPHIAPRLEPHIDIDWIGQESEWEHHLEVWRFFQSGQILDVSSIMHDWRDQSTVWPSGQGWRPGAFLSVGDTLFRFTEIFEFAARLALTDAGDEHMHIGITVSGIRGRALVVDDPRRTPMFADYKASIQEFPYAIELPRAELIANPRELALRPTMELFWRFRWEPAPELLREQQEDLRRPS